MRILVIGSILELVLVVSSGSIQVWHTHYCAYNERYIKRLEGIRGYADYVLGDAGLLLIFY